MEGFLKIIILNIGKAGVQKRAYLFTPKGKSKHEGKCDGEADLGFVLRNDLLMPGTLRKKES